MKNITKALLLGSLLASTNVMANDSFASFGLGYAYTDNAPSSGLTLAQDLKTNAVPVNIEVGHNLDAYSPMLSHQFVTLGYTFHNLDHIVLNTFDLGYNYKFKKISAIQPYAGVTVGYVIGLWNTNPVTSESVSTTSYSISYAGVVGANYKLLDNLQVGTKLQVGMLNLNTKVGTSESIKQSLYTSLLFNLSYSFNILGKGK